MMIEAWLGWAWLFPAWQINKSEKSIILLRHCLFPFPFPLPPCCSPPAFLFASSSFFAGFFSLPFGCPLCSLVSKGSPLALPAFFLRSLSWSELRHLCHQCTSYLVPKPQELPLGRHPLLLVLCQLLLRRRSGLLSDRSELNPNAQETNRCCD